jgi:hypothetical protein
LLAAGCWLAVPLWSYAQDANELPLGDVARNLRNKKSVPSEVVIDNDNFSKVVDEAERKKSGSTMVFSLDSGGNRFKVSSPDVSCNLSFSAKVSSLLSDPAMLEDLPGGEVGKLEGPASIDGDSLQVSMYNGTSWQLREVVIGLTIVRQRGTAGFTFGHAHVIPAAEGEGRAVSEAAQKQADVTVLIKVRGSAAPATTALFRTQLNFALFPDQEWHWAIVKARGIPPKSGQWQAGAAAAQ